MQFCNAILISKEKRNQFLAAFIATTGGTCIGTMLAWSSPVIPNMLERGRELEGPFISWIVSISMLGAASSIIPAGIIMEKFGSRKTTIISSVVFIIGWIIAATASTVSGIMAGRFVTGIGGGGYSLAIPLFIREIAQDEMRRKLGPLFSLQIVLGVCVTYIIGSFLSWIWLTSICGIFPLLHLVGMFHLPESPTFMLYSKRQDEAVESLEWYRGVSQYSNDLKAKQKVHKELLIIEKVVDQRRHQKTCLCGNFTVHHLLKPFAISVLLTCFQQFSGVGIAVSYAVNLLKAGGSSLDPKISLIVMGIFQVLASLLSTLILGRTGRKLLLTASLLVMAFSYVALGSFFYVKENSGGSAPNTIEWIPVVSLIAYASFYSMGIGPISGSFFGEMLPDGVVATAILTFVNWLLAFIVVKTYEDLSKAIGNYGCFWLYAAACLVGSLYTLLIVPGMHEKNIEDVPKKFGDPNSNEMEISRL